MTWNDHRSDRDDPAVGDAPADRTPSGGQRRGPSAVQLCGIVLVLAAIVAAGSLFGWKGWLTASIGGIGLIILLPCLVMCVGLIWMIFRGSRDGS